MKRYNTGSCIVLFQYIKNLSFLYVDNSFILIQNY